jgi:predicted kinase
MRVIVLVGLPGSGKSTWAEAQGITVLSSDGVRALLADDVANQQIHDDVFATMRYVLRKRLRLGARATILDATNLLPAHRRPWVKLAQSLGAAVEAVYFDTPVEECQRRNAARARVVPAEVIDAMAGKLRLPSKSEGFNRVAHVRPDGTVRTD